MYITKFELLSPGDILLTTQKHSISKAIRVATGSGFSHSVLHRGDGSYIHADGDGVHSGSLQRWIFDKPTHLKVLRLRDQSKLNINRLTQFCSEAVGTQYSVKEALRTKLKTKIEQPSNRQFCSRLVAEAYLAGGVKLVTNPHYCSPADIENSPLLNEVRNMLTNASDELLEFSKSESPLDRQTNITNLIFEKTREITGTDIQTFKQIENFLESEPKYDLAIATMIEDSGYLDLWKTDLKSNPWRYNATIFMQSNFHGFTRVETAHKEIDQATRSVRSYEQEAQRLIMLNSRLPLRYYEIHIFLCANLVKINQDRIEAAEYVINTNS